jgi:hypothetical protein
MSITAAGTVFMERPSVPRIPRRSDSCIREWVEFFLEVYPMQNDAAAAHKMKITDLSTGCNRIV